MSMLGRLTRRYKILKWRALSKISICDTVVAEVHGKKMYLDLSDRVHCEILYATGIWEKDVTAYLMKLIEGGMVVIDIGANVGYYTLLAAEKVGGHGKVFAFEPEPSRYALLEKNVRINGLKNVILVQQAVSNKTGTARL